MEEAAKVGPASREENHAHSKNKLKDKRLLIAIATVIIFILVIVGALLVLNNKKSPSTTTKNGIPAELDKNVLAEQSQQYIDVFAQSSIKSSYIPKQITVLPTTDDKGIVSDPNRYSVVWNLENGMVGTFSIVLSDVSITDLVNVSFLVPVRIADLDTSYAPTVVGNYFSIAPQGSWKCNPLNNKNTDTLCENFWIDQNSTKKGIGVLSAKNSSVFYCEIYPTSKIYYWNSCIPSTASAAVNN